MRSEHIIPHLKCIICPQKHLHVLLVSMVIDIKVLKNHVDEFVLYCNYGPQ